MIVIVGCEFSQVVTTAFRNAGHEAYSCDILPAVGNHPEWHYQCDILDVIDRERFDLGIFHPPCTYLCSSGMHWTTRGLRDPKLTDDAIEFVKKLLSAGIKHIALENPIGCISTRIRKPDQIIHPWMFGHDASKATCLWLQNLPKLALTEIVPPKGYCWDPYVKFMPDAHYEVRSGIRFCCHKDSIPKKMIWANQTPSGQNKLGPSQDRWADRSVTYSGIAEAMVNSWGKII
jgi:hypothetical protein